MAVEYLPSAEFARLNETEQATIKFKNTLLEAAKLEAALAKKPSGASGPDVSRINSQTLRHRYGQARQAYIAARSSNQYRNLEQYQQLLTTARQALGNESAENFMVTAVTQEVIQHSANRQGIKMICASANDQADYGVAAYIDVPQQGQAASSYFRKIFLALETDLPAVEIPDEQLIQYDIEEMHKVLLAKDNLDITSKDLAVQDKRREDFLRQQSLRDRVIMDRLNSLARREDNQEDARLVAKVIVALPNVHYNLLVDFKTGDATESLDRMIGQDLTDARLWRDAYRYELQQQQGQGDHSRRSSQLDAAA